MLGAPRSRLYYVRNLGKTVTPRKGVCDMKIETPNVQAQSDLVILRGPVALVFYHTMLKRVGTVQEHVTTGKTFQELDPDVDGMLNMSTNLDREIFDSVVNSLTRSTDPVNFHSGQHGEDCSKCNAIRTINASEEDEASDAGD